MSSAAPSAGTWVQGDIVQNTASALGGIDYWVCTTGGTPGTWTPHQIGVLSSIAATPLGVGFHAVTGGQAYISIATSSSADWKQITEEGNMAIIINIGTNSGVSINQSYARIDTTNGSKESQTVTVNYYVSKEAFEEGKDFLKQEVYTCPVSVELNSPNFIKQEYEYLKTLPEFAGAVDA